MNISYDFIPAGSTVSPVIGKIYLDVGNNFCPGIIDNHSSLSPPHCSSYLTCHNPEYVKFMARESDKIQIITHKLPDIDAIFSSYIASKILTGSGPTENDFHVADIVDEIDAGKNPFQLFNDSNFFLYFYLFDYKDDLERLNKGYEIFNFLDRGRHTKFEILNGVPFEDSRLFSDYKQKFKTDHDRYKMDLARASIVKLILYNIKKGMRLETDVIIVDNPSSLLFKYWSRTDNWNSPRKQGFSAMFIVRDSNRYIISVAPESDYTLRGLGDALERAETNKREKINLLRIGTNRAGYNSPDPWYDGRFSLHNYTIIDTPMNGTVLTREKILSIFLDSSTWIVDDIMLIS
jgi:hypothetical protein